MPFDAGYHRHVVRLYEVYETPDNVYMVLENCPCGDLEKMLYMRGWVAFASIPFYYRTLYSK